MNRSFLTLVKREFWECKSLWIVPLAMACVSIFAMFFASEAGQGVVVRANGQGLRVSPGAPTIGAVSLMGIVSFIALGAGIAAFAYLLDCLFSERRDRSILFWKSLPVSDAQTVLAKLAAAMIVVPLLAIVMGLLAHPVIALIAWVRLESVRPYIDLSLFAAWPGTLLSFAVVWLFSVLWFAPVATYLLLASVVAKRTPLMYAVMPPVALIGIEKLMFDTGRVARFLGERLFPWNTRLADLVGPLAPNQPPRAAIVEAHWWVPFQEPALWIGLAVAAGMLYVVIRLRRYRDDT
jgi:ABC-2 type transport system permease protein